MPAQDLASRQSILADQFFYFFLRLRKKRIRAVVEAVNSSYPEESAEQKARRLIEAQTPLSFLGGTLIHLPMVVPGLGQAFSSSALLEELPPSPACTSISSWRSPFSTAWISKMRLEFPRCCRWLQPPAWQPGRRFFSMFSTSTRCFPCRLGR